MSIMSRLTRRDPLSPDEAMRLYVEAIRRDLEPDPIFRRRLRGTVMNQFVARREGVAVPTTTPLGRQMGTLGRACLYASFALALSVGGVMAASETAIPGDLLYPLKRSIEDMRMEVAPAHLRDDLVAAAIGERLDEISRLVEKGAWETAASIAVSVEASYEQLVTMRGADAVDHERFGAQLARLARVLESAPVGVRQAIVHAMDGAPGLRVGHPGQGNAGGGPGSKSQGNASGASNGNGKDAEDGNGTSDGAGAENGTGTSEGSGPAGPGAQSSPGQATVTPTPKPTPEPEDQQSERAEPTPKPTRTPRPQPTPGPSATDDPEDVEGDES